MVSRTLLTLGLAAVMTILVASEAPAAQDPNDLGIQDSIIIDLACVMDFGRDSLKVSVVVVSDNDLFGVFIPIFYDSPGDYWKIDTAWFISDRWQLVPMKGFSDRYSEVPDTAKYLIWAQAMVAPIPAGRDSIATITFRKNPNGGPKPGPLTIGFAAVKPQAGTTMFVTAGRPTGFVPAQDVHYPCNCSMVGDCDNDGTINPVDVVFLFRYSMKLGDPPPTDPYCPIINRGDFDCDNEVTFSDVVQMVNYVYRFEAPGPCNPCSWEGDTIPPAAVDDLAIADIGPGAITLEWSAPGDDGDGGTAAQYDIRYSTQPITDKNWRLASPVPGKPAPRPSGTIQTVVVPRLSSAETYYFALKSLDEARLVSPISNQASGTPNPDFTVNFPDQVLDSVMRTRFNRETGELYASEMLTVQELIINCTYKKVSYISGLEYCSNLRTLFISSGNIRDLNSLAGLSRLRYLNLAENRITDITPLAALTNLEWLYLLNNQIFDINVLANLPNLNQLLLADNAITDLSPLLENPGIEDGDILSVGHNPLSAYSLSVCIPALIDRGVRVIY